MKTLKLCSLSAAAALGLGLAGASQAASLEYPSLYKDPRALSMGGADIAVGGRASAMFSNPAGLSRVPQRTVVELLPFHVALSQNFRDLADDMEEASDIEDDDEQREAFNDVIRQYRGENFHAGVNSLPSVTWRGQSGISFAFGVLANGKTDVRMHQGSGSEGLMSVNAHLIRGLALGGSYDYDNYSFGATIKSLNKESLNEKYSVSDLMELSDDDEDREFDDDLVDGKALGLDLGVIYRIAPWHSLSPSVGASLLNVGDMNFGDAGTMPMTVNIGAAIHPEVPYIAGVTLAVDYVDVFNGYEQDSDMLKRLRIGVEAKLWNRSWSDFTLRAGLHQGYATAGAELRLRPLTLGFTTYSEEVGAYGGQDRDRRYIATLALGW